MTTASAPAKAIILGEHTALYKNPVLVAALDLRARVTVTKRKDKKVLLTAPDMNLDKMPVRRHKRGTELVDKAVELVGGGGFDIEIESDIPLASGMGSSASIAAALMLALKLEKGEKPGQKDIAKAAWDCEHLVHSKSSGVDPFAVTFGGLTIYQDGHADRIKSDSYPEFVVAHSGVYSDTWEVVQHIDRLRNQKPKSFEKFLELCKMLVAKGEGAVRKGDWRELGSLMDKNHRALSKFDLSCPELEEMIELARGSGALGAKLTGAGRGGIMIALVDNPDTKSQINKALSNMGKKIIHTQISEEGARLE